MVRWALVLATCVACSASAPKSRAPAAPKAVTPQPTPKVTREPKPVPAPAPKRLAPRIKMGTARVSPKMRPRPKRLVAANSRRPAVMQRIERLVRQAEDNLKRAKYGHAVRFAREALMIQSDHADAVAILIVGMHKSSHHAKAKAVLLDFTKKSSAAHSVRFQMAAGAMYEHERDWTKATMAYRKATGLKPDSLTAWNRLGLVQLRLPGAQRDAVAALETALSLDRDSVIVLTNLGTAYRRLAARHVSYNRPYADTYKRAEKLYRTAIALRAGYAPAYFNLALMLFEARKYPGLTMPQRLRQAEQYFRQYKRIGYKDKRVNASIDSYIRAAQKARKMLARAAELKREKKRRAEELKKKKAATGKPSKAKSGKPRPRPRRPKRRRP